MEKSTGVLSNKDYHSDTSRISKSGLDLISKSPAHYWEKYLNPNPFVIPEKKEDKHFEIGDVFHTATLEPHKFFERYLVTTQKVDRRTTDGKIEWSTFQNAANGRKVINGDVYAWAMKMRDAAMANPIVEKLLSSGYAERTCHFTEPETGALCKCRPDWESSSGFLVDLKSTVDASPEAFRRSVEKFRYWVQDPFYRDGIFYERGTMPVGMVFVAVEKRPPFNVGLYTLDGRDIESGRAVYLDNLRTYLECKRTGNWRGYSPKIVTLKLRYL